MMLVLLYGKTDNVKLRNSDLRMTIYEEPFGKLGTVTLVPDSGYVMTAKLGLIDY